ncbi:MAG TPA: alpha-L-fucosidase [Chryseosolibacter sp.]|nr:alpha-L-fucosidase [Chryseosolibacter sp.]
MNGFRKYLAYFFFGRFLIATMTCLALMSSVHASFAQHAHPTSTQYQWPADPLVREKLDQWQDLKFGMIIHWGIYAEAGIIESWSICSEDWITRDSTSDYGDYKKWYWGLSNRFNPIKFDPDQWARAAKAAGMRYMVFTTKHHDGFNMFDTRESDFKITNGPFGTHPKSNVAFHVFDAFRRQGMMIGAYYSKPDWHNEHYWWPLYATPDRNNNYDIRKNPWRWHQFKQFTFNQISELMSDYGRVDILWLDGGWVRPLETVNDEVRSWGARIPEWSQDIDLPKIAGMARAKQPGVLIVDRTVHGMYENYLTPEQNIPKDKLDHPWESCMTLGNAWSHVPHENFKSATRVIHILTEIVAKGGSLLLGVGPDPKGLLSEIQIERLAEIGLWLKANGQAIYSTRPLPVYRDGNTFFTRGKDGSAFAIVLLDEGTTIPSEVSWKFNVPAKNATVKLLMNGKSLKWKREGDAVKVLIPADVQQLKKYPALAFSFTPEGK